MWRINLAVWIDQEKQIQSADEGVTIKFKIRNNSPVDEEAQSLRGYARQCFYALKANVIVALFLKVLLDCFEYIRVGYCAPKAAKQYDAENVFLDETSDEAGFF